MRKKISDDTGNPLFGKIKWGIYSLRCSLHNKFSSKKRRKSSMSSVKVREKLFLTSVLIYPLTIFLVFYVYVNINCILLSFQDYDFQTGQYVWSSDLFSHFTEFFTMLRTEDFMSYSIKNSCILFAVSLFINLPFHILNAYYVYKKKVLYRTFRILLFLPSVLSSVITVTMFKYFLIYGLRTIYAFFGWGAAPQLLGGLSTGFATTVVYSAWIGFGGSLILFCGLMNRIPPDILEAASLDGVKPLQEFWYIIMPLIFPTINIYIINLIAGFFSTQGSLFTFYGESARREFYTFGYYYYIRVIGESGVSRYPMAAASGIIFTLIVAPITLLSRWLLDKWHPSVDY